MSHGLPDTTDDLLAVSRGGVGFYVLRDEDGLYLIDSGFIGAPAMLEKALKDRQWNDLPIRGILLTHGHLDHILNAVAFARRDGAQRDGAWIAGPEADRDRYAGRYGGPGSRSVVGRMEAAGRRLLRFEPFVPDRWVGDGEELPIWHGLRAIALPGHTAGHTGYWCEKRGLLFCGDLFASLGPLSHRPPFFLNEESAMARQSIAKALALNPRGVLPHHCDGASPERHLERLRRLG